MRQTISRLVTGLGGGIAPGLPVRRRHPVRRGDRLIRQPGRIGVPPAARVSRSSRHDRHPVRNERFIEHNSEYATFMSDETPDIELMYDISQSRRNGPPEAKDGNALS